MRRSGNALQSFAMRGLMAVALSSGMTLSALAQPSTPLTGEAAYRDPVVIAQDAAERAIGRPVILRVTHLVAQDGWAFILSEMLGPDGGLLDYSGTHLEEAAREGGASHVFCALLRQDGQTWTVIASCLGATDVAWEGWDRQYGAPRDLFRLGEAQ